MKRIAFFLLFFVSSVIVFAGAKTKVCNFDGLNSNKIYTIYCRIGFATAFEVPKGTEIREFVIGDPKLWKAEASGRYGFVRPFKKGINTSLSIITTNDEIFVFDLVESDKTVVGKVIVEKDNTNFFKNKVKREVATKVVEKEKIIKAEYEAKLEAEKEKIFKDLLFSINKNYIVKNNVFQVGEVADNGVFTYITFQGQDKPAVYVAKRNKKKNFEPVKYVEKDGYYEVHYILEPGEKFYLKLGEKVSYIKRK